MGVVMTNNKIRPMLKRGLLAGAVLVTALVATTGTALAERPAAGHWEGTEGVSFKVEHHDSTVVPNLIKDIHWHAHHFPHSGTTNKEEFESCYSYILSTAHERHYCINGQFSSHRHASGTVISFLTHPGHHARFHTHRYEWTATPVTD
jgi:hypothetical protein